MRGLVRSLRLGLLALLLACPTLLPAQSHDLIVQPADASLLRRSPGDVVTSVSRISNRSAVSALLESELLLPSGWPALAPGFPFQVGAGQTGKALVSFIIPSAAPAGDYLIGYRVRQRGRPAVIARSQLRVRVLPRWNLSVDVEKVPRVAIANEPFSAAYRVSNHSNAPLTVAFLAHSRAATASSPAAGRCTSPPAPPSTSRCASSPARSPSRSTTP